MGVREEPFATFVAAYRERLLGTATLVHLDADRAGAVVDAALVRTYADWPRLDDPYGFALRAVLDPAPVRSAGAPAPHFDLVDVETGDGSPAEDIGSELRALTADERRILVLARYDGLPTDDIARILDRDPADVAAQLRAATAALDALPRPTRPRRLATELAIAARPTDSPAEPGASGTDPVRAGRVVLRRRRLAAVGVALVLVLLAVFGVRQLQPTPAPVAAAPPGPPCDTSQAACRTAIISTWRTDMANVVSEYLDPTGRYFTGLSYSFAEDHTGSGYFGGGEGAVTLDLYRVPDGATEVYLQIATSRSYATRCGAITGRVCHSQKFMDGNTFNQTDPFDVAHGLEIQFRPDGTYVITVVARNISTAKRQLDVERSDLMQLVLDPRLKLPAR